MEAPAAAGWAQVAVVMAAGDGEAGGAGAGEGGADDGVWPREGPRKAGHVAARRAEGRGRAWYTPSAAGMTRFTTSTLRSG